MKLVVKIGGTLIEDEETRRLLALQIGGALAAGHHALVVHGGGAQLTAFLKRAGIEPTFIEGRRVTSPEVLDAAVKVMAGSVNHQLLATFASAGVRACGISGVDGACLSASRAPGAAGSAGVSPARVADLGLVGRIERVETRLLDTLAAGGYVPLLAPLAVSRGGQILNVNADEVAVACAAAWMADRLVFLTDVEGVRGADGRLLAKLTPARIQELVTAGVATGGMLAKLRAAAAAVLRGVPEVGIAGGREPRVLRRLLAGEALGTAVRADAAPPPTAWAGSGEAARA